MKHDYKSSIMNQYQTSAISTWLAFLIFSHTSSLTLPPVLIILSQYLENMKILFLKKKNNIIIISLWIRYNNRLS